MLAFFVGFTLATSDLTLPVALPAGIGRRAVALRSGVGRRAGVPIRLRRWTVPLRSRIGGRAVGLGGTCASAASWAPVPVRLWR